MFSVTFVLKIIVHDDQGNAEPEDCMITFRKNLEVLPQLGHHLSMPFVGDYYISLETTNTYWWDLSCPLKEITLVCVGVVSTLGFPVEMSLEEYRELMGDSSGWKKHRPLSRDYFSW